jgi:hypothetical protein
MSQGYCVFEDNMTTLAGEIILTCCAIVGCTKILVDEIKKR